MSAPRLGAWMDRLAHDLRGPLTPMLTAVYLLRDTRTSAAQRDELLAMMERQVQRLGSMIDEVSDLGRAEKGRLVGRTEPVDIELLAADVAIRLQDAPPEVSFGPDARGVRVEGDVLRMGQLFRALLGLQFSRRHPVPVHARFERAGDRLRMACTVHCHDADALPVALLVSLPHPEPQDDTLGLGLMIASAIAEAHGGGLRCDAAGPDAIELVLELPIHDAAGARPVSQAAAGPA
jgi:signal transduction histidine kinase